MTAAATREVTLHLPSDVLEMAERAAETQGRPLDSVVAELLADSLAEDQSRDEQWRALLVEMSGLSTEELRNRMHETLQPIEQERLSDLLQLNRERTLTPEEDAEIERLIERVEQVSTVRTAAIWTLQQRAARK